MGSDTTIGAGTGDAGTVKLEHSGHMTPNEGGDVLTHEQSAQRAEPREPEIGEVLKGRYRLEERIGRGGMSIVYRATDLEAVRLGHGDGNVAIKVLGADFGSHEAALFDEVQKTRRLQQENIVDVYGFEPDQPSGFMVMELLSGVPLDRFVSNSWPQGVPMAVAYPYIKAMGTALSYAHTRGVIHSDFKPSNVLVGPGTAVKVLDFGIARAARGNEAPLVPGERATGLTPAYASCEMLEEVPADLRDDVFCFGLAVYFMLSGSHPFNGLAATEARDLGLTVTPLPGLTRAQNAALERAMRFKRDERSSCIAELVEALAPAGRARQIWRLVPLAALVALAALAAVAAVAYLGHRTEQSTDELVRTLCPAADAGQPLDSAEDIQVVPILIAQGNSYLARGQRPFDAGMLYENVSSAYGAFLSALNVAPHECDAAARGIAKVATAYRSEAERLYAAGDYRKAAATAATGLRIWKDNREMRAVFEQASRQLPPDPPVR